MAICPASRVSGNTNQLSPWLESACDTDPLTEVVLHAQKRVRSEPTNLTLCLAVLFFCLEMSITAYGEKLWMETGNGACGTLAFYSSVCSSSLQLEIKIIILPTYEGGWND